MHYSGDTSVCRRGPPWTFKNSLLSDVRTRRLVLQGCVWQAFSSSPSASSCSALPLASVYVCSSCSSTPLPAVAALRAARFPCPPCANAAYIFGQIPNGSLANPGPRVPPSRQRKREICRVGRSSRFALGRMAKLSNAAWDILYKALR